MTGKLQTESVCDFGFSIIWASLQDSGNAIQPKGWACPIFYRS